MDGVDGRNMKKDLRLYQRKLSKKCSAEDISSQCPDSMLPAKFLLEELPESTPLSVHQSYPIPVKLVSAMKGSRAEQGRIFEKLSVKWASDVYDPPQTLLSHTVNRKKQNKKLKKKKNGKKAQTQSNNNRKKGRENKMQIEKVVGNSRKCDKPVFFDEFKKCNVGGATALVSC